MLGLHQIYVHVLNQNGERFLQLHGTADRSDPPITSVTLNINDDGTDTEEVQWICNDGDLELRFHPAQTPFDDATGQYESPTSTWTSSLPPHPGAAGPPIPWNGTNGSHQIKLYKYSIIVTTADGYVVIKDPYVIARRKRPGFSW